MCSFFLSWEKTSSSSCNVGHCHKCTYTQIHIWHTVVLSKRFSFISKPLRDWQVLWLMEYCKIEQSYVFNKMTLGLFVATSTSKQLWFGNGCSIQLFQNSTLYHVVWNLLHPRLDLVNLDLMKKLQLPFLYLILYSDPI